MELDDFLLEKLSSGFLLGVDAPAICLSLIPSDRFVEFDDIFVVLPRKVACVP